MGRTKNVGSDIRIPCWSSSLDASRSFTDRTKLSEDVNVSTIIAKRQSLRSKFSSQINTTSPTSMLRWIPDHFRRLFISPRYSCLQRVQKMLARYCTLRQRFERYKSWRTNSPGGETTIRDFWVRRWFGERGSIQESDKFIWERGRQFIIADTSCKRVIKHSSVREELCSSKRPDKTLRIVPIWRSNTPPKCDAEGGLNTNSIWQFWDSKNDLMGLSSIFSRDNFNSFEAPTKFVPWSQRIHETGPLIEMKRRRAKMNESEDKSLQTSIWIALEYRQVKTHP